MGGHPDCSARATSRAFSEDAPNLSTGSERGQGSGLPHPAPLVTAAFLALVALLVPTPAAAQIDLTVRVHGAWSNYDDEYGTSFGLGRSRLHLSDGRGYDLAAEVIALPRLGIALGIGRLELDGEYDSFSRFGPRPEDERPDFHADGTFVVKPLTLGLVVHPLPRGRRVDLRLGAHAAYVQYDVRIPLLGEREDEFGYAATIGLDVPVGTTRWGVSAEARYLEANHEEMVHGFYGNFGTWMAHLGASYHFPIR